MNLTPIFTPLAGLPVWLMALLVPLLLLCIGCLIWPILPRGKHADIERQIKTLRREADHAVTRRPRVRANGCTTPPATHIKAAPIRSASALKPCGGGLCRHRADCVDHYCPGRPPAPPPGPESRYAHH